MKQIIEFIKSKKKCILITVEETTGSAPRNCDAFMLVGEEISIGTVGGGRLEYNATQTAREILLKTPHELYVEKFRLGPELSQCCGGTMTLKFESLNSNLRKKLLSKLREIEFKNPNVLIFGAGHVGKALIEQMTMLPLNCRLIDSRTEIYLDGIHSDYCEVTAIPEKVVREAPKGSAFVIVTHDHAMDFLLVKEVLARGDSRYLGMIGSKTKKNQLRSWLRKQGVKSLENLVTPIGGTITDIKLFDKRPETIAALTAAEILIAFQSDEKVV